MTQTMCNCKAAETCIYQYTTSSEEKLNSVSIKVNLNFIKDQNLIIHYLLYKETLITFEQ